MFRTLSNYYRYTDAFSRRICKENGVAWSSPFLYKCIFLYNPETTVCLTFLSLVSLSAYVLRILEVPIIYREPNNESGKLLANYFYAFWLSFITISTVGYGDTTPNTYPGKVVMSISALIGAFMISLFVLIMSKNIEMN